MPSIKIALEWLLNIIINSLSFSGYSVFLYYSRSTVLFQREWFSVRSSFSCLLVNWEPLFPYSPRLIVSHSSELYFSPSLHTFIENVKYFTLLQNCGAYGALWGTIMNDTVAGHDFILHCNCLSKMIIYYLNKECWCCILILIVKGRADTAVRALKSLSKLMQCSKLTPRHADTKLTTTRNLNLSSDVN